MQCDVIYSLKSRNPEGFRDYSVQNQRLKPQQLYYKSATGVQNLGRIGTIRGVEKM
jgi:hypothetical protein